MVIEKLRTKALIKRYAKLLLGKSILGKKLILFYSLKLYLERIGYLKSFLEGLPVERDGNCLPWFTYPMISFLSGKLRSDMTVFEYGSGHSTLWWSKQVASVTSCEHDLDWYNYLKQRIPPNVTYIYCPLDRGGEYSQTILKYPKKFDIVVIDGRDRINCAKNALAALKDDGAIVWDNSDRQQYHEGYAYLTERGFRRIDFKGLGPIGTREWCTSIFYRDNNCFKI